MLELRDLSLADALIVCAGMRPMDRACLRAVMGEISDEEFAANRWGTTGPAWAVADSGSPVAIGGISFQSSWSGVVWLVATPALRRQSWRKLIRHARTVLRQILDPAHELHRHRVEAYVLGGWEGARALVGHLGFQHEGTRHAAGSRGEDIETWALWRRKG